MKVKALRTFHDRKAGTLRNEGDVFEADDARVSQLMNTEFGSLVAIVSGQPVAVVQPEAEEGAEVSEGDAIALPEDKLTVRHIKDILEARGVEYRKGATRPELIELMHGD